MDEQTMIYTQNHDAAVAAFLDGQGAVGVYNGIAVDVDGCGKACGEREDGWFFYGTEPGSDWPVPVGAPIYGIEAKTVSRTVRPVLTGFIAEYLTYQGQVIAHRDGRVIGGANA